MSHGTVAITPRPLTGAEGAVMRRLLDFADPPRSPAFRAQLADIQVVAVCACGCPSLFFAATGAGAGASRAAVADVYGVTPEGFSVGVMLWAKDGCLEYLDVWPLGDWPPYGLPDAGTLTPEWPPAAPAP